MGEEVSNKVVLLLALLVVLVVAVSTWLMLNKLNSIQMPSQAPQPKVVHVTEIIEKEPVDGANVKFGVLPRPGGQ